MRGRIRVREWRERRGMTYRGLATRAGGALSTPYRIESGQASPTVDLLTKLAAALEIGVRDFFPADRRRRGMRRTTR